MVLGLGFGASIHACVRQGAAQQTRAHPDVVHVLQIPDGKAANSYGFGAKALDAAFARGVVAETSAFYQRLRAGTCQAAVAMA